MSFFRDRRALRQRWLGIDYYPSCEHVIDRNGRQTESRSALGLQQLATWYYERYRIPLFHSETNRPTPHAVEWLEAQWREILGLRVVSIPVRGFTWYSLTDQVDWQYGLRVERNEIHPVGLFDLDRVTRSVGRAYGDLVWQSHRVSGGRSGDRRARAP